MRLCACVCARVWVQSCRFIHLSFNVVPHKWIVWNTAKRGNVSVRIGPVHQMLLISSNLVDDHAINALHILEFVPYVGTGWTACSTMTDKRAPIHTAPARHICDPAATTHRPS